MRFSPYRGEESMPGGTRPRVQEIAPILATRCWLMILGIMLTGSLFAQRDSLVMKNGDILVGEIKEMNRGLLTIETPYSDKDFIIEWTEVKEAYGRARFLLVITDGRRINGRFYTDKQKRQLVIKDDADTIFFIDLESLVYIKGLKSSFWGRVTALADVGFNVAKANNLRQFTANVKLGYLADTWQAETYYSQLYAIQDSVNPNRRVDAGVSFRYFLQHDWFLASSVTFLSNTEQSLQLRSSGTLGGGKFLTRTNRAYWAVGSGFSFNNETFFNATPARKSLEAYLGTDLNLFDIGDLTLSLKTAAYYSLTEAGRWRLDLKTDLKYDLPLDFYIKTNFTVNYDTRPAEIGNDTDYVWAFTVGWKL